MKDPETRQYFLHLLFLVILTSGLTKSTDTSSFWKQKADIFTDTSVGKVTYTNIPALSEFTACLDVYFKNDVPSTVWSYCGQDGGDPELGFRRHADMLEVFLLGEVYEVKTPLKQNVWYIICLRWSRQTTQLEVYVNGQPIYYSFTEGRMLKGNGSLALGASHTIKGGQIVIIFSSILNGCIYNFQMWNYTMSPEEMIDCSNGNLISWTEIIWNFARPKEDVELRCANVSVTPTPSTTTPTTVLGTTTSTRAPTPAPTPTETLPTTTESLTTVTSTPGIFSTSVTLTGTASSNSSDSLTSSQLPETLLTSPSTKPTFSTKASTTESLSGDDLLTNSSINLPTGNNVSTTGNISSTYQSPPGLGTTSAMPITSRNNSTTIQQQSTDGKSTPDLQVLSTRTPNISTQPDITSKFINETTFQTVTTSPTTKSTTPSALTNVTTLQTGTTSPTTKSITPSAITNVTTLQTGTMSPTTKSITPSAVTNVTTLQTATTSPTTKSPTPSAVTNGTSLQTATTSPTTKSTTPSAVTNITTPMNILSTTTHITPSKVTESPVSHSKTTYISSSSSMEPLQANKVTFYIVEIITIQSTDEMDQDMASSIIQNMMNQILNNTEFVAVQFIVSARSPSGYIAKSIVRANSSQNTEVLSDELQSLLVEGFTDAKLNGLVVQSVNTGVIAAEYCRRDSTKYNDFTYDWPETSATEKASLHCHTKRNNMATRECYINVTTLQTEWGEPNYSRCVPSSFEDLENFTVTPENANYLSMQILNMTKQAASLPENDIRIILNKVSEIIALGEVDLETAKVHVDVINFVLEKADTSVRLFTNKILNLMEEVGFKMNFTSETANVTTNSMALLVSKEFKEIYFTVTEYLKGNVEIALQQSRPDKAVAFIHLPKSIQDQAGISSTKVQFNFIGSLLPFKDYESRHLELNTYIISASFEGTDVENLREPIDITLQHFNVNVDDYPVKCAFWDFSKNNNLGGWNTSGCSVTFTNKEYTSCSCNHLTHFGVLLDIARTTINPLDEHILSLLTYVGCGIAALFLGISLVTYGMFRQLRRDYPSKILMNLSFSLLMLNLLFLVNNWLSSLRSQGLCISIAALLHYFLLTSFTWMALEAVHMYFAFVKVFNSYIHKYILKLCIAGWGIPLVVVVAVLCVNVNFYGSESDYKQNEVSGDSGTLFCWIQNDIVFYVAVVSYFGAVFLINISMFIVVLLQIQSLKSSRIKDWKALFLHDIKNTLSLAFLLGLTWGFAFFAWGPVRIAFLYLFAVFNTLQGFFIFVFHCLIKENVRRHWKMYLCCGRCRLDNYSDWSRLSNADAKYSGRIHLPSDSYQSTRSNNTASTNTSSLSSLSRDAYYGNSYGNGGGIFMSSAPTAPLHHATEYPNNRRKLMFLD
ncbi:adhesion G-protein coupled receptor G4 isoform X2 [Dendropsophus ebraccatus]|uniref:adhesion G-protein coupled receptor G4 isoform X2 n=1 Tax=Dendropsophus ebraccatus TaxID=150705 RepID=UPI0038315BD1